MKDIAKRRFDEERITFRNGMGKGHITKAKGPKREAALIVDDIDLDIVRQPLLFQLAPNESSGERCRVKRYIKISSKIGNGADLVVNNLKIAIEKDPSLKEHAKTDVEFLKWREDAAFKAVVN